MADEQKENIASNGNAPSFDHDEYQYLKLIKNIIETGSFHGHTIFTHYIFIEQFSFTI